MQYKTLGRTGLEVSEIGLGAWAIGGPAKLGNMQIGWGHTSDAQSLDSVKAALDVGISFFDTADAYGGGHSEELLGKALKGVRQKVIVASKGGNRTIEANWVKDFSPAWIPEAVDASLQRLRIDCIDVYFLHTPRSEEQFQAGLDCFDCLERLKEAGKIRHYGISVATVADGIRTVNSGFGDVIQVVYNILERAPEEELFPLALEHNIGIVARVPLASGFLTGKFTSDARFPADDHRSHTMPPEKIRETVAKVDRLKGLAVCKERTLAQVALQYVLSHQAVSVAIPGGKNETQVRENAKASDGVLLSGKELAQVREVVPSSASGTAEKKFADQFRSSSR